ncbi:M1 family metallopeptidase [Chitinophaga solisilvae]|uniref:M1 family metallopeptidase n=1 Tax=Chitinophaga solisilvae TaxID=1233460 RepID=A0A3S1B1X5_9BACT|nr:M1 family metallopeptidase [Chitinophaga solisilvae]NSL85378.1 M1 family metallopeptidase [Chitinophaga solisilvae]
MRKFIFAFLLSGTAALHAGAQELYMPRNVSKAYAMGTRNMNGKPGNNYWQNKARYDIQITAAPPSRIVYGRESITYINNSPNDLSAIAMRLICNVHKPEAPRSGYSGKDYLSAGVVIDTLIINGTKVKYDNDAGTVSLVRLPAPLVARDSMKLSVAWHYELSVESGREGAIDSTTFFLAYYYPRISVYDDYNGWDLLEHTGRVEFYSDFNDYRVAVKVPKNFIVWGTGELLNAEEVLQPEIFTRFKKSLGADDLQHIATLEEVRGGKVTRQNDWNTWRFKADHIADVAAGISDHYVWDAASVMVDSTTRRRASVQAAYNDTAADFRHSVTYAHTALNFFSHQWPGVAYPFPVMTAFQGYADMEYPMMVNDATVGGNNLDFAQLLQDHEIAHTYFPFYMGINESRYAFMDEGWATTFEYLAGIAAKGKEKADDFYRKFRVKRYISDLSAEEDQPIISMSHQVSGMGYGSNSYGKASLAYLALKDLLGDDLFKKCLHAYMRDWNGKHPIPWDFFNAFNAAAGQNLNWFWNNWFFSNNYIDLAAETVSQKSNKVTVKIKNNGGFAIPFDILVRYEDGTSTTTHHTPAVWKANTREVTLTVPASKPVNTVMLEGNLFMDASVQNNYWHK